MAKKLTAKQDAAFDKKRGIKPGSKADMKMDKKMMGRPMMSKGMK